MQVSGSAVNLDNVTTKFIMSICFVTLTRSQNGQMSRMNEGKGRCILAINAQVGNGGKVPEKAGLQIPQSNNP